MKLFPLKNPLYDSYNHYKAPFKTRCIPAAGQYIPEIMLWMQLVHMCMLCVNTTDYNHTSLHDIVMALAQPNDLALLKDS